jgi:hypothetical protein
LPSGCRRYKPAEVPGVDVDIPDNIRRIFDRIFTLEAERQKGATGTVQAQLQAPRCSSRTLKAHDADLAAVKAGPAKAQEIIERRSGGKGQVDLAARALPPVQDKLYEFCA